MGSYLRTEADVVRRKAELDMYGGLEISMSYLGVDGFSPRLSFSLLMTLDGLLCSARMSALRNRMSPRMLRELD